MKRIQFMVLAALFLCQTAMAQHTFSPSVNILKNSYQNRLASGTRGETAQERGFFVLTCSQDASTAGIANKLKEMGGEINSIMGNMIAVSLPVSQLEAAAAIEGVLLIDIPSGGSKKTDITRNSTEVQKVLDGTGEKLPQAYTGKGVIIGVIDGGFDYTHPAFKDKDGKLRIKGVYLPHTNIEGGENLKNISYTDEKNVTTTIDLPGSFITDSKVILDTLKLKEGGYHGTHCAVIAAGSTLDNLKGVAGGSLGGMAPEADILLANDDAPFQEIQKVGMLGARGRTGYYRSVSLYALKHYAAQQGKPLVISISSNDHLGFHDGTSTNARMFGNYCKAGNLMALCASNEGAQRIFLEREINAGKTLSVWLMQNTQRAQFDAFLKTNKEIKANIRVIDLSKNNTEVYKSSIVLTSDPSKTGSDDKFLNFVITKDANGKVDCNGLTTKQKELAWMLSEYFDELSIEMTLAQGTVIGENDNSVPYTQLAFFASRYSPKVNQDKKDLYLLEIDITSEDNTKMYAWSDYDCDILANSMEDTDQFKFATNDCSMGDWNTSGEPVTIGAWIANNKSVNPYTGMLAEEKVELGDFCPFSSFGHDLSSKKREYPDVSAPGYNVVSANNSFNYTQNYVEAQFSNQFETQKEPRTYGCIFASGTSMATPAAAGIIALWVQAAKDKNKTLTNADIKDILKQSSDTDNFTKANKIRFGSGKINAYKGLLYVLGLDTGIENLSLHQPDNVTFRLEGNKLYTEGAEDGTPISLYNLQGVRVAQTAVKGGAILLDGLTKGVYAVQLGKLGSTLIRL